MENEQRPKLAAVKSLYKSNARQIPQNLRRLADEVENPPAPAPCQVDQAVCVIRDSSTGQLNIYGWGDVKIEDSIAMLQIASNELAALAFQGRLWTIPVGGSAPKSTEPSEPEPA